MNKEIREFFDKLEKLIELEVLHLIFTSNEKTYDFLIIKKDSEFMKKFIEETNIKLSKKNKSLYYYENGYKNIENFIIFNLMMGRTVGLIAKAPLFKKWQEENKNLFKVYGFCLLLVNGKL